MKNDYNTALWHTCRGKVSELAQLSM